MTDILTQSVNTLMIPIPSISHQHVTIHQTIECNITKNITCVEENNFIRNTFSMTIIYTKVQETQTFR